MSEFQFTCPFCDTLLDCPEELDGVETECPVCNKIIVPILQLPSKISVINENNQEAEDQKRDISLLEVETPITNQSAFLAKCPACKKIIELDEELKYSKKQCPFCNKTVILNTVKNQKFTSIEKSSQETVNAKCSLCKNIISCPKDKIGMQLRCPGCGNWTKLEKYEKKVVNEKIYAFPKQQDYQDVSILSPTDKHDAFRCKNCENITIISKNSETQIICHCCNKFIWLGEKNKVLEHKDESLTDFISAVKYEAGIKNKKVFFTNSVIQKKIKEQIEQKKKQDAVADTALGCGAVIFCILLLIGLGSCISSCDTKEDSEITEWKLRGIRNEIEAYREKQRRERAIEKIVDYIENDY